MFWVMTTETLTPAVSPIETLDIREAVFQTPYVRVDNDAVRWPDGRLGDYAKVITGSGHGAVVVPIAIVRGMGYFGMVRQFRYPIGKATIEFPRGGVADDGLPESHEAGATRELHEETGALHQGISRLGGIHADTGILDDDISVWLAIMAPGTVEAGHHEEGTGLRSIWISEGKLAGMVENGAITCGITLAAYALYHARRPQLGSLLTSL